MQMEVERCAVPGLRFCPDPAAVPADDALYNRKPHAGPLEILFAVQSLEDSEEPVGMCRIEPDTVVTHEVDPFGPRTGATDVDLALSRSGT